MAENARVMTKGATGPCDALSGKSHFSCAIDVTHGCNTHTTAPHWGMPYIASGGEAARAWNVAAQSFDAGLPVAKDKAIVCALGHVGRLKVGS